MHFDGCVNCFSASFLHNAMQKLGVYFAGVSAFLLHNSMQKSFYQMSWGVIINKCVKISAN